MAVDFARNFHIWNAALNTEGHWSGHSWTPFDQTWVAFFDQTILSCSFVGYMIPHLEQYWDCAFSALQLFWSHKWRGWWHQTFGDHAEVSRWCKKSLSIAIFAHPNQVLYPKLPDGPPIWAIYRDVMCSSVSGPFCCSRITKQKSFAGPSWTPDGIGITPPFPPWMPLGDRKLQGCPRIVA